MTRSKKSIQACLLAMQELFPHAATELKAATPFQFLVAVILSAQATDVSVNLATPGLFAAFPDAESLGQAPLQAVEAKIQRIGLYKSKAKNIIATAKIIHDTYHGQLPESMEELIQLPGVGRKTANVVRGEIFNIPSFAVDTHVERVSKRLQFVTQKASVLEVEEKLRWALPESQWVQDHHTMIFFGRYHCTARKPQCITCPLLETCNFGQKYVAQQNGK